MAVHTKFVTLATRLILKHGRPITLAKSGVTLVNVAKPWLGTTAPATEATPEISVTARGLFVNQADQDDFGHTERDLEGTQLKRGEQRVIISQGSLSSDVDVSQYDILIDADGRMWRILETNLLQPGTTKIIYDIKVTQ